MYGHFPIVMGINLSEGVTIVPTIGATYIGVSTSVAASGREALVTTGGFTLRGGLGVQFRPSKKFALHPEVSVMRLLEDVANTYIVFGLGFNFGAIPAYDDLRDGANDDDDEPEAKPREERKKPAARKPAPAATPEANGAPPVVASPEPTAPSTCKTTCTPTDAGALPAAESERVAAALEPLMRDLRSCLDRIGGQSIRPAAFLRYGGDGAASMKLELSGYEDLACAKEATARHPVRAPVSRPVTLRCEARCN